MKTGPKQNRKRKQPTLSLCMIVKNEEAFLESCLESVRELVHQIVILDTGSTDKTTEIARRFGADIYSFNWCDDFSAARNASIQHATGDWILWLDADERLMPASKKKLQELLKPENKPVIYRVHIRNHQKDDGGFKLSTAHRLFTNHKGIQFSGRIHEQVSPSAAALKGEERDSEIVLDHYGYALQDDAQTQKNLRNRKLLIRFVREKPDSAYAHYTLAQHYAMTNEPGLAKKHYIEAYDLNQFDADMKASLLNTMAENRIKLNEYQAASKYARESIALIPQQVSAYYLMYRVSDATGDLNGSITWLEQVCKKNEGGVDGVKSISSDVLIDADKLAFTMGSLYLKAGRPERALAMFEKVPDRSAAGNNPVFIQRKLDTLLKLNRIPEAYKLLDKLILKQPGSRSHLELSGLLLIKLREFDKALDVFDRLYTMEPDNNDYLKRLAGLYAKTGHREKAEILVAKLNNLL